MVLGHVNRTAWGTKLLLMAVLASLVDCISSCRLLKAQYCSLSSNVSALLFELTVNHCIASHNYIRIWRKKSVTVYMYM